LAAIMLGRLGMTASEAIKAFIMLSQRSFQFKERFRPQDRECIDGTVLDEALKQMLRESGSGHSKDATLRDLDGSRTKV
jgi:hypothetical protein